METTRHSKDDASMCFHVDNIADALALVSFIKHGVEAFRRNEPFPYDRYEVRIEKKSESSVQATRRPSVSQAISQAVDLRPETQNDTDPRMGMEEELDTDPSLDIHENPIVADINDLIAPSTPYPLPPANAKSGYKTRVCVKIPKFSQLTAGYPCTFGKGCTYAHTPAEAAFYLAHWAAHQCCKKC
jgi:hypothetical protein